MAHRLAPLRADLDGFPSDDPRQPGLVLRDTAGFSEAVLVIPAGLVPALGFFDGEHTDEDLAHALREATGELAVDDIVEHLEKALSSAGMLEDDHFVALRDAALEAFRASDVLPARHGGPGNYPTDRLELNQVFGSWFRGATSSLIAPDGRPVSSRRGLRAIAAPHASPGAARASYTKAYGALADSVTRLEAAQKTFVILGTSHYGQPDRFGLTRKRFVTPLGETRTNTALLERLSSQSGAELEDHCFGIEHSIEFQIVFLQYLYGPDIQVLPILCGSYARSLVLGGKPEQYESNAPFLDALGELAAREGDRLQWILGVDMAHKGPRYGAEETPRIANGPEMEDVAARDKARISALERGDRDAFWAQVQEGQDPLNWCGSAPFYTYLATNPHARGELLSYEHWQIDPESVVSFAAMTFTDGPVSRLVL